MMGSGKSQSRKRRNRVPIDEPGEDAKRLKQDVRDADPDLDSESIPQVETAGRIKKIVLRNFICHDHLVTELNSNVNFFVGRNGSGKSAILTAITVGLGGRASKTQRGDSLKAFIKHGKSSFTIEITLTNEGPNAYEPKIYGNIIRVTRTVSESTSTLTLKGQGEHVISKKKADLIKITGALNIQVENPISILNQKASKTFLIHPKPSTLYGLFMEATQLDVIGNNYKEAQQVSRDTQAKMHQTQKELKKEQKQIDEIREKIQAMDDLEAERAAVETLESEVRWARVIAQEAAVKMVEKTFQNREKALQDLVDSSTQNYAARAEEIDGKMENISQTIEDTEQEAAECDKARDDIQKKYEGKKHEVIAKQREYRTAQKAIKNTSSEIDQLSDEITRLEQVSGNVHEEKAALEEQLKAMREELFEVEARIETTRVAQAHSESNKIRLERDERDRRMEKDRKEAELRDLQKQLNALSQGPGDALGVYGNNVRRLLKRIDEEVKMRRFRQKPRGPIGAFIKMKDPSWTTVVEKLLGGIMTSFCVDNSADAVHFAQIVKEVYNGERGPDVICSKFIERTHDVRSHMTRTEKYSNVYDVMEIADPIIANCIIDQRSPECILLIPTDAEALALLQNIENVPTNCRSALTRKGDTYYPDPNFRTYGGRVSRHPRFLQVSCTQAIHDVKQEIAAVEDELITMKKSWSSARQSLQESVRECSGTMSRITQLCKMQTRLAGRMDEVKDQLGEKNDNIGDNRGHYIELKAESERKLEQLRIDEAKLGDELSELQNELKNIQSELTTCREKANGLDGVIAPLRTQIRKLQEEKRQCQIQISEIDKRIISARHAIQEAEASVQIQKRTLQTYLDEAEKYSRRVETKRTEQKINEIIRDKKNRIRSVELRFGSRDELQKLLDDKLVKYGKVGETLETLMVTNEEHLQRVESRREEYKEMRSEMGEKVEESFGVILALREYRGSLKIDYYQKTLTLDVIPQNTAERGANQTMTLSGGERSYTTVAFILALWDCTKLPFYFLDEFDVFMDKVNRRVIVEMLLMHTRKHCNSQYGFFTPLDASIVRSSEFLTIHQLAAPERGPTQTQTQSQ